MKRLILVLVLACLSLAPAAAAVSVGTGVQAGVTAPGSDVAIPAVNVQASVSTPTPSVPSLPSLPSFSFLHPAASSGQGPTADSAARAAPASNAGGLLLIGAAALGLAALAYQILGALGASAVTLASRLDGDELLEDPTRAAIHALLLEEPGLATTVIATRLDLAWGTVTHHLGKLENHRLVVSRRYGKYRRYFVNGAAVDPRQKDRIAALQRPRTAEVARIIRDRPGIRQKDVGERLGVAPSTVLWHVRRLVRVGLVCTVREGRFVTYYPDPRLLEVAGEAQPEPRTLLLASP